MVMASFAASIGERSRVRETAATGVAAIVAVAGSAPHPSTGERTVHASASTTAQLRRCKVRILRLSRGGGSGGRERPPLQSSSSVQCVVSLPPAAPLTVVPPPETVNAVTNSGGVVTLV